MAAATDVIEISAATDVIEISAATDVIEISDDTEEEVEVVERGEEQKRKPPAGTSSAQSGGEIYEWPRDDGSRLIVREREVGGKKLGEGTKARVRVPKGPLVRIGRTDSDSNSSLRRHKCLAPWRFRVYKSSDMERSSFRLAKEMADSRYLKDSVGDGDSGRRLKALAPWRFQRFRPEEQCQSGRKECVLLDETFGSPMPCPPRVRISAIKSMHRNKRKCPSIDGKTQADILDADLLNNKDQETVEGSARKRKRVNYASTRCGKHFSLNIKGDRYSTRSRVSHKSTMASYGDSHYVAREKVMELLSDFRKTYKQQLAEDDGVHRTTDLVAFKLFRKNHNEVDIRRKYLGSVPGVEVGDMFHLRVELYVVGLHCHHRRGIDFIDQEDKTVTCSIVYSGKSDGMDMFSEVLEYSCYGTREQGWKFDGESLALKNSMDMKTPVRVVCHSVNYQSKNSIETRARNSAYVYNGLYFVDNFLRKRRDSNQYLFIFQLRRMQGQPNFGIKDLIESKRLEMHSGLYIEDISNGNEKIPISAVNGVDDEPLPLLKYMPKIIYPSHINLDPPLGCDCIDGCSDSIKCACAAKNGGALPFNSNGAIVEAKRLVFECGPSCKCPPSCHNRVSQHGIKVQLQVFKTKLMGWGVRSLTEIPSGSFICEYVGDLLTDEEAEGRATDEYIFSIGNNYYDETLWEGISSDIPALQKDPCETELVYNIDTSERGNVGKFFNHSCTPNLYAQNLLYDHDNKSIPHIVFFAAEDISPMEELTYHYNYAIGEVHDANGNIKKKNCYCGSHECTGRLY